MWGISYIFVALLAPNIAGDVSFGVSHNLGALIYTVMGILILVAIALYRIKVWSTVPIDFPETKAKFRRIQHHRFRWAGKCLFCILGAIEVAAGVASWTGIIIWNVPFVDKALFQVSMACMDLISATFMFLLAISHDGD